MEFQGFTLDKFQEDAVKAVNEGHSVLVSAPTGSGKTLIADYIIDKDIREGKRIVYTAPIKALSNQKFKDFCNQYGEDKIGLITGDLVINPMGQVLIMTTEVYRNMAIIKDYILNEVSYCIMDEIHFISDEERGYIWEESIIFSPDHIRFLFLSATIPNSEEFAAWVRTIKNHRVVIVKHHIRPVPLERKFYDSELGITTLEQIREKKELDKYPEYGKRSRHRFQRPRLPPPDYRELAWELKLKGKLPCIYFVFSRARTQEYAVELAKKHDFLEGEDRQKMAMEVGTEFRRVSGDIQKLRSTQELRQCLSRGIGFHNAGLLPDAKHVVEKLFGMGLIKVLFATETFAVGINMPAKTVCFDSLRKFTGRGFRLVNSKEYFQISGRAGRRGIDKSGLSVAVIHRPSAELDRIAEITREDTLPLKSQFQITYNTALNMVKMHSEEEIQKILTMNLFTFQKLKGQKQRGRVLGSIKARFTKLLNTLIKLKYIENGQLTELGQFASKIFSDEIEISQLFKGEVDLKLDEYSILMLVSALVYEGRREVKFLKKYNSKRIVELRRMLAEHPVLRNGKWPNNMENMSAFMDPCYHGKKFIEILQNTNMPEGDLIRLFMRILDKLEQIDKALEDWDEKTPMVRNCKQLIRSSLEGIHVF
ncbi:DEAD/DEAH box helicase [Candidatus Woesearchaeota archaeon]|nr:DEAD/DEAH box helicase [Candidatus Woesearchaeota archaeon]